MDITPELQENAPLIEKYGNGGFMIASQRCEGSVLLSVHSSQALDAASVDALDASAMRFFTQAEEPPELILFGCGMQMQMLPKEVRDTLDTAQIGYDAMDTGAACRTFNILLMEDRKVGAVLLAV